MPHQEDGEEPVAEAFGGAGRQDSSDIASDLGCLRRTPANMSLATALVANESPVQRRWWRTTLLEGLEAEVSGQVRLLECH